MTTNKQTVLCVDGSSSIHRTLQTQLQSNGYTSYHAVNGDQAIRILARYHVDLILLDLNIKGMNAFTTLSHLKSMPETEHIPVIFLSNYKKETLEIKGLEYGADDFIIKPFTNPILLARIKAVLRRTAQPPLKTNGIQGNVKSLSIFDLLQMLTFSDKSCTVLFPEMHGKIVIESGDVISISQSSYTGEEALIRLSLLNHGTFQVQDGTAENAMNVKRTPLNSLVFSTAVQIDEIEEKIKKSIPASLLSFHITDGNFEDISSLKEYFPLSPQQLSGKMPGKIMDNVEQMAEAYANEVISAADAAATH
jgi:CheY-like chemotaxis protein